MTAAVDVRLVPVLLHIGALGAVGNFVVVFIAYLTSWAPLVLQTDNADDALRRHVANALLSSPAGGPTGDLHLARLTHVACASVACILVDRQIVVVSDTLRGTVTGADR